MPRIAARTESYDTLRECMRHYKAKRDHLLHLLGKISHIDGSQFLVAFISPKGEVHTYQSALLKEPFDRGNDVPGGALLNMPALEHQAQLLKTAMKKRREEDGKGRVKVPKGGAEAAPEVGKGAVELGSDDEEGDDDDGEDDGDDDPDKTLIDDISTEILVSLPKLSSSAPGKPQAASAALASAPKPTDENAMVIERDQLDAYFSRRFSDVQQDVCKLVAKAWIKVIEPKKQSKFPYNKGVGGQPAWWPEGVEHRAPDHISKEHRMLLLSHMLRSGKARVTDLELSTASIMAWVPYQKLELLREICMVAKAEERLRDIGDMTSPVVVIIPPSLQSSISPPPLPVTKTSGSSNASRKRPAPLGLSTNINTKLARYNSMPEFTYPATLGMSDSNNYSWRPAHSPAPGHQLSFTPLGLQMAQDSPLCHSPLLHPPHQQIGLSTPSPATAGPAQPQQGNHLPPALANRHRAHALAHSNSPMLDTPVEYKSSAYYSSVTTSLPSPAVAEPHTYVFLDTHHPHAPSPGPGTPGTAMQTTLSMPGQMPHAHVQHHAVTPAPATASADFVKSTSGQGYTSMQQQQIEFLETHQQQQQQAQAQVVMAEQMAGQSAGSYEYVQGYRYEYQPQPGDYDYGMPTIAEQF